MSDFADKSFDMIERLQKRIAELEAELKETIVSSDCVCDSYAQENQRLHDALAAERKRRENAEAALAELRESTALPL